MREGMDKSDYEKQMAKALIATGDFLSLVLARRDRDMLTHFSISVQQLLRKAELDIDGKN